MATEVQVSSRLVRSRYYSSGSWQTHEWCTCFYSYERDGSDMVYSVRFYFEKSTGWSWDGNISCSATIGGEEKTGVAQASGTTPNNFSYTLGPWRIRTRDTSGLAASINFGVNNPPSGQTEPPVYFTAIVEEGGAPAVYVKVNNSWKEADAIFVKVNNEWKEIDSLYVKLNNQWNEC